MDAVAAGTLETNDELDGMGSSRDSCVTRAGGGCRSECSGVLIWQRAHHAMGFARGAGDVVGRTILGILPGYYGRPPEIRNTVRSIPPGLNIHPSTRLVPKKCLWHLFDKKPFHDYCSLFQVSYVQISRHPCKELK